MGRRGPAPRPGTRASRPGAHQRPLPEAIGVNGALQAPEPPLQLLRVDAEGAVTAGDRRRREARGRPGPPPPRRHSPVQQAEEVRPRPRRLQGPAAGAEVRQPLGAGEGAAAAPAPRGRGRARAEAARPRGRLGDAERPSRPAQRRLHPAGLQLPAAPARRAGP